MKHSTRAIKRLYAEVLKELGAEREPRFMDIRNTPARVAKMLTTELLVGYSLTEADLVRQLRIFPSAGMQELVVQANVPFTSMCAHHMLPFSGTADIGYLPGKKLLGLSKLSRILDYYAARLQVQERLGAQVADFLMSRHVKALASFVVLSAEHYCMKCRGVRKTNVVTVTSSVRPIPPDKTLLSEFYALAERGRRAV